MRRTHDGTIRGLLLDLDGTVADTLPALRQVYARFLDDHRVAAAAPEFDSFNGVPLRQIIAVLCQSAGLEGDASELTRDYQVRAARACEGAAPRSGAADLLRSAREAGYRTAIVTSGDRVAAAEWLGRNALEGLVDELVGAGEASAGKPSPEPYRVALERLAVASADSIAVEDSILGACSAVAAGLATYVLAEPRERSMEGWPPSSRFVAHLDEVGACL